MIDYQKIYDEHKYYGVAMLDRCPSFRLLPRYHDFITFPLIDVGCGRGELIQFLNRIGSYIADGIDIIDIDNGMQVGDITKPFNCEIYKTALCIDVVEHLTDEQLKGLFDNLVKIPRLVITAHNGPSIEDGIELHINKKSFCDWEKVIKKHGFKIVRDVKIYNYQRLYCCEM